MPLKSFINRRSRILPHVVPVEKDARKTWKIALLSLFLGLFVVSNPAFGIQNDSGIAKIPGISFDQIQEGWISLFDGQSLYGWKPVSNADWRVENGTIKVASGERGLLRTTTQFDDFEMTLEFFAGADTNSGVFLRTSPSPKNVLADCYELNIANPLEHNYSTGSLVGRSRTNLKVVPNQWHQIRVLADGAEIEVWIDDTQTVKYTDPNPLRRGYIGLQFNSGAIAFRNICIKPLNINPLFDGSNLDQWKSDQALQSSFSITAGGELQVLGGRGQLESKAEFGDFVFSMQCRTNAVGLNSGIFFRSIPGELMNGYESQIQNQFKNGDRSQPVDCGTGGIFRRINARQVNANDKQWFTKTIIATGPHVSTWVNGYQVTDWTDKRKPNINPRKGLRLKKGTLILQGHDPTTDLLFKNIGAREIAPRK